MPFYQNLEINSRALSEFYLNNGYLDFKIIDYKEEIQENNQDVYIYFTINEGEKYKIENIELNTKILSNKLDKLNNYFIIINPCINLLTNIKLNNIIINLIKLILISVISFFIFLFFGKLLYLNNLLKTESSFFIFSE